MNCSKKPNVPSRDGNGSNLDRVQMDPDPDPFSLGRPGFAGLKFQDPDPYHESYGSKIGSESI